MASQLDVKKNLLDAASDLDPDDERTGTEPRSSSESLHLLEKIRDISNLRPQPNRPHRTCLVALISTTLLTLVVLLSLLEWRRGANELDGRNPPHCGNSSVEAISMGCRMEPMLYGWVPPECFFEELSAQYTPFEDRNWYAEEARENQLDPSSLWMGELPVVWTIPYHEQHCLFLWRKLALAIEQRQPMLDNLSLSIRHADHCADYIYRGRESPNGSNYVILGFYTCEILPWA